MNALRGEAQARSYIAELCGTHGLERLRPFVGLLLEANAQQNLISRASEGHIWERHIADSAQLLEHVSRETRGTVSPGSWLDLGSGPGLPGLVIALLEPEWQVTLVESRPLRAQFLQHCVDQLGVSNCTVIGDRLERLEPFECWVISARAFAPLEKLLRLSAPFSTKATRYILPKGRSAEQELEAMSPTIRQMFHVKHSVTDSDARILVSA